MNDTIFQALRRLLVGIQVDPAPVGYVQQETESCYYGIFTPELRKPSDLEDIYLEPLAGCFRRMLAQDGCKAVYVKIMVTEEIEIRLFARLSNGMG